MFQTSSGNGCDQKKITLLAGKPVEMMMMMMMMMIRLLLKGDVSSYRSSYPGG